MLLDRDRPFKPSPEKYSDLALLLCEIRSHLGGPIVDPVLFLRRSRLEETVTSAVTAFHKHSQDKAVDDEFAKLQVALMLTKQDRPSDSLSSLSPWLPGSFSEEMNSGTIGEDLEPRNSAELQQEDNQASSSIGEHEGIFEGLRCLEEGCRTYSFECLFRKDI